MERYKLKISCNKNCVKSHIKRKITKIKRKQIIKALAFLEFNCLLNHLYNGKKINDKIAAAKIGYNKGLIIKKDKTRIAKKKDITANLLKVNCWEYILICLEFVLFTISSF